MLIMNQISNLKKLGNLSYFDKETLSQFVALSDNSLYANVKRWLKKGDLIGLKKGLYVTRDYLQNLSAPDTYRAFIANKLREPSYLSLEHVLQKYGLLTEAVFAFTSVTLKSKRRYKNRLGVYLYLNIKADLFQGYNILSRGGFDIKEATKAKALFDYLYLKLWRTREINHDLIRSLRLNLNELSAKDIREFSGYCDECGFKKFLALPKLIRSMR